MEAEEILKLFDTCWFGHQNSSTSTSSHENQHHKINEKSSKLSRIQTNHTRSMSDQLNMTSFKHDSMSPNSVVFQPNLQTILSGIDVTDYYTEAEKQAQLHVLPKKNIIKNGRRTRESKSLSDLEFEEVKGFMDLGFVFSEEDKDTNLVTIIPGLQRLGKNGEKQEEEDCSAIQRPYLSEAWEIQERRKEEKPLMKWKIPAPTNEVDMKYSLKCWAHTVASTVK
ncbi:hypothetical protein TSUD_384240 [Trifolium subterraneum]|uniref:DUF1685 domain-containing protein n=1 Tax=Trifolium subterraneum TaxID=3900 RepID=A0A2Z6NVA6_TRISU|nr:hypothetical protein TSUD_384240 [Trifolium subterraneum]